MKKTLKITHDGRLDDSIKWLMNYTENKTASKAVSVAILDYRNIQENREQLIARNHELSQELARKKRYIKHVQFILDGFKSLLN